MEWIDLLYDKLVHSVLENCQFIEKLLGGTETATTTKKGIYVDLLQINVSLLLKFVVPGRLSIVTTVGYGRWLV